jgi:hypothetical protein
MELELPTPKVRGTVKASISKSAHGKFKRYSNLAKMPVSEVIERCADNLQKLLLSHLNKEQRAQYFQGTLPWEVYRAITHQDDTEAAAADSRHVASAEAAP